MFLSLRVWLTLSAFCKTSLFLTTFYIKSTLAHGILWACSNLAIGYLLNILGCHFPWTDFIAP